ncbi:MAG: hypothetical protein PHO15_11340 [Eubacteriales bacterium]|nr:hypothetical protein [Eubacteriales bacterium]
MNNDQKRRLVLLIICVVIAVLVAGLYIFSGTAGLDTAEAKNYITENHTADTSAENAVTAVYLNYRYWDTLFESLILLVSVLAVISLSWSSSKHE